jgi:prepilin-type N-terminal cleavage/methylation domain-containing protein/prepilin-type processing-associated H-X9-DG protein
MRQQRSNRPGFTLIELLVVIAVIALLIGILLPALGKARSQGQSAKCQGHMRQYGTAHQIYITDYDVMPGLGQGEGSNSPDSPAWVIETGVFSSDELGIDVDAGVAKLRNAFLDKYLKDARVTSCPADPLSRPGAEPGERIGNMLTVDEDPRAAGTCMTRIWFNWLPASPPPPDYVVHSGREYVTLGGLTESHLLQYLRPDRLSHPSLSADSVEEDEDSTLSNSVFVPESWISGVYPPIPGTQNLIADNHPAKSGNIVYHDGHVSNIPDMHARYWAEDDYETRMEILWWDYYKDNNNP